MDFKDLLKLAKNNQSYLQQKHEREKQTKAKTANEQSEAAAKRQKAALLKKQKELQLKKESTRLEAQRRLLQQKKSQLQLQEAKNKEKLKKSNGAVPAGKGPSQDQKKCPSKMSESSKGIKTGDRDEQRRQRSCGSDRGLSSKNVVDSNVPARVQNKSTPGKSSANGPLPNRKPTKAPPAKEKAMSFAELMNLAKTQKNKPPAILEKHREKQTQARKEMEVSSANKLGGTSDQRSRETSADSRSNRDTPRTTHTDDRLRRDAPAKQSGTSKPTSKTKGNTSSSAKLTKEVTHDCLQRHNGRSETGQLVRKEVVHNRLQKRNGSVNTEQSLRKRKLEELDQQLEQKRREIECQKRMINSKYKRGYDEEEEYIDDYDDADLDDDLDDFIDDSGGDVNVSKYIESIFGYKKARYVDEDDDLRDMESNYKQIQQEESRSSRIGKMEDEIERIREQKMLAAESRQSNMKKR